ncbi:MAG: hypothetical protein WC967_09325 [Balneolaceae bacterium]
MKPATTPWVKKILDSFSSSLKSSGFIKAGANQNGASFIYVGDTRADALIKMREVNKKHLSVFTVLKEDPRKLEFTYWLPLPVSEEEFIVEMSLKNLTVSVELKRQQKQSQR